VGFQYLSYCESAVETFELDSGFDLVIGRYILIHQTNPVTFLRAAARLARPGGPTVFHEIRLREFCRSDPGVPLLEMIDKFMCLGFSSALPHYDAADRLVELFARAGLPEPGLFCETRVWDRRCALRCVDGGLVARPFTSTGAFGHHSGRLHGDRNAGNAGQGCCAPNSRPGDRCAANLCLDQNVMICPVRDNDSSCGFRWTWSKVGDNALPETSRNVACAVWRLME
jgi:hypothetical protein